MIVCDTGPIVHLKEAGLLELLKNTGSIYIPKLVDIEITELEPLWKKSKPEWIYTESLLPDEAKQAEGFFLSGLLDLGEAEARIFANSLGIEVHGSLGIVLWSAAVGHLNHIKAKEALVRLSKTSLWVSKNIIVEAQDALNKMFV